MQMPTWRGLWFARANTMLLASGSHVKYKAHVTIAPMMRWMASSSAFSENFSELIPEQSDHKCNVISFCDSRGRWPLSTNVWTMHVVRPWWRGWGGYASPGWLLQLRPWCLQLWPWRLVHDGLWWSSRPLAHLSRPLRAGRACLQGVLPRVLRLLRDGCAFGRGVLPKAPVW